MKHSVIKISVLVVSIILLCSGSCRFQPPEQEQYQLNILWIVCEDQWSDFFPMYGDSTVSLPTLERIANEGIVFENAFATVPVCAPSRSALITGMYPTTLGTHNMRTYNGYSPVNQPSIGIPSYSPVVPENIRCFTEYLRIAGYYCTNNAKEDYNFKTPISAWDESGRDAHWRNRAEGQPFFSVFNFNVTHESSIWVNGDSALFVEPELIMIPPFFPDDSVIRHDLAVNYSNLVRLDKQVAQLLQQLKEDGLYDKTIIFFYSDNGGPFPRFKRALYETGIKIPLFIRFPGNAGESERCEDLVSFIDFGPTVLSLAGIKPPGHMQGQAFLGEFKSKQEKQYVFTSADRFDETYDRVRAVWSHGFKYIRNFNTALPYAIPNSYRMNMPMMQRLLELDGLNRLDPVSSLWMADNKPEEELYDLMTDPYEIKNLAGNDQYRDTLLFFRDLLDNWIIETNDLGRYRESELVSKWLIDGKQPVLVEPEFTISGNDLIITSDVPDATLLWKYPSGEKWIIYHAPISYSANDTIEAKAVRIGYTDSEVSVLFQ